MKTKINPVIQVIGALGIIGLTAGLWMHVEGKEPYLSLYPNGFEVGLADEGIDHTTFENRPELGPDGVYGSNLDGYSADGKHYHAEGIQFNGISRLFGWIK